MLYLKPETSLYRFSEKAVPVFFALISIAFRILGKDTAPNTADFWLCMSSSVSLAVFALLKGRVKALWLGLPIIQYTFYNLAASVFSFRGEYVNRSGIPIVFLVKTAVLTALWGQMIFCSVSADAEQKYKAWRLIKNTAVSLVLASMLFIFVWFIAAVGAYQDFDFIAVFANAFAEAGLLLGVVFLTVPNSVYINYRAIWKNIGQGVLFTGCLIMVLLVTGQGIADQAVWKTTLLVCAMGGVELLVIFRAGKSVLSWLPSLIKLLREKKKDTPAIRKNRNYLKEYLETRWYVSIPELNRFMEIQTRLNNIYKEREKLLSSGDLCAIEEVRLQSLSGEENDLILELNWNYYADINFRDD